jgi:hypothetical protein
VFGKMMKAAPAVATKLVSIIHSGNSNIDHLHRRRLGATAGHQDHREEPGNGRLAVGKTIIVFDLRKTIATTGKDGHVCDP